MAIFHATTRSITRSTGASAVAVAAQRSASRLVDERTGQVHDHMRKTGVLSTEILLPDGSLTERNALWNAAEAAEKRKDSRTAREWEVALPAELDSRQRHKLARRFAVELVHRYGVAVDLAIHAPSQEGDRRNHSAHCLTTTRQVHRDAAGVLVLSGKTAIELSDRDRRARGLGWAAEEVKAVRELWQDLANEALARAGRPERIDARSLKEQGIDREATSHLGAAAVQMERRGIVSDRGDANRQIVASNQERKQLRQQLAEFKARQS